MAVPSNNTTPVLQGKQIALACLMSTSVDWSGIPENTLGFGQRHKLLHVFGSVREAVSMTQKGHIWGWLKARGKNRMHLLISWTGSIKSSRESPIGIALSQKRTFSTTTSISLPCVNDPGRCPGSQESTSAVGCELLNEVPSWGGFFPTPTAARKSSLPANPIVASGSSEEIELNVELAWLKSDRATKQNGPVTSWRCYDWLRRKVLRHYLPYDRSIFGKLKLKPLPKAFDWRFPAIWFLRCFCFCLKVFWVFWVW